MTEYLVDTNVILDVTGADHRFGPRSKDCLARCAGSGVLVINPAIYAEVGAIIERIEELNQLLPADLFRRDPIPWEAAYLAGRAFRQYRRRGGARSRVLADFLIGAHAATGGMTLITRDQGYSKHFRLDVQDPTDSHGKD
jgi:predicted nucleic acid-binding protein